MKIVYILVVAIVLIVPTYFFIDESVARYIMSNKYATPILVDIDGVEFSIPKYATFYRVSGYLSEAAVSTYFLVVSALLWGYFKFRRKIELYAIRAAFFFLSVALSGIVTNILKFIFGKARPRVLESDSFFGFTWFNFESSYHSFPSGHTTTAFAIFMSLTLMFPKYWWIFLSYAVTMALARVGFYAHYPSDTIAGAAIGMSVTLLLYRYWKSKLSI